MKLLLSSDGKTAIESLGKLSPKPAGELKVAWIITATKTDENSTFLDRDLQEFLANGITPNIYDIKGRDIKSFEEDLADTDIIFMEGGNTFYLLKSIRETGFDQFLANWIKQKPYVGVSAGSYIMCPTIEMATWKRPDRARHGLEDLVGLNNVDFLLSVHFKEEYRLSIEQGMQNTELEIKILKDGQALLVEDGQVTLLGDQGEIVI